MVEILEEAANGDEKVNIDSAWDSGESKLPEEVGQMFGEELDAIHIKGQASSLNEIFKHSHPLKAGGRPVAGHSHKATEVNESRQDFNDIFKVLSFSS